MVDNKGTTTGDSQQCRDAGSLQSQLRWAAANKKAACRPAPEGGERNGPANREGNFSAGHLAIARSVFLNGAMRAIGVGLGGRTRWERSVRLMARTLGCRTAGANRAGNGAQAGAPFAGVLLPSP